MTSRARIGALAVIAAVLVAPAIAPAQTTKPAVGEGSNALPGATTQPAADPVEEWIQQTKHPVSWLTWGADERMRDEFIENASGKVNGTKVVNNGNATGHEMHFERFRTRLWATVTPFEAVGLKDIEVNARLMWEFRNWALPKAENSAAVPSTSRDLDGDEAMFDVLNVKWKNILGAPATVTVGRQEILLGDGWLVSEGTPLDGSRTNFFDAVRTTYNMEAAKTTADLIYICQYSDNDQYIRPFNDRERPLIENNERGAIVWLTNRSIEKTEISPYFIYKHDEKVLPTGDNADIYTYGGRVTGDMTDHWQYRAEIAQQLGQKNGDPICALGSNNRLIYQFNDPMMNQLRVFYEYLSGDNPNTKKNEAFDVLWGRWQPWSELMPYTWAKETRIGQYTNLHRVGGGWSIFPLKNKKLELATDYHLLFAPQNTYAGQAGFSENGCFRGQLLTAVARYSINEHIRTHIIGEAFFPGDYYSSLQNDPAFYLRYEVIFAW